MSFGHDQIAPDFLRITSSVVTPFLRPCIQQSFSNGIFPENCTIAKIIPIFKKGDCQNAPNYRHPYMKYGATYASASPPKIWLWCTSEFFWSSLNLLTWTKSWSRFIPPMLKIVQNWGKIAKLTPPMLNKDRHSCIGHFNLGLFF